MILLVILVGACGGVALKSGRHGVIMPPPPRHCINPLARQRGQVAKLEPHLAVFQRYADLTIRGIGLTSSGTPYIAYAGSENNLPLQGLLVLAIEAKDPCQTGDDNPTVGSYPTPSAKGTIVAVAGLQDTISMTTSQGVVFLFSVPLQRYVSSLRNSALPVKPSN
jgi:hypothetical protein